MLVYGIPIDACDQYVRLGKNVALEAMKWWIATTHNCFGKTYLQHPMHANIEKKCNLIVSVDSQECLLV